MSICLEVSALRKSIKDIRAGDSVLLSGVVYTSRDAAHARIKKLVDSGAETPFILRDSVIYYAGPTPPSEGNICGSFGPTTSSRMDAFAPLLYDLGVVLTIGKGERSEEVTEAIKRNKAAYFIAIGGAGALAAKRITAYDEIAFRDLGCESVKRLMFENFPLICAIDMYGGSVFKKRI